MPATRRILLASDFSRVSTKAFAHAISLARTLNARLIVLHVLEPATTAVDAEYVPPSVWERIEAERQKAGRRRIAAVVARARRAGVRATPLLLWGDVAGTILRTARRERADLLVLGTHGRSGVAKLILGSVATRVIAGAPCPVLTVRGRPPRG
ncbi:MAG TPA: universal stress protein [Vicinamibacterales bacterium]|nr:universal stress protein [Vicinamibacterales bacterium]